MPPPTKSSIWTYFILDKNDPDKSECKLCRQKYSRKGRSTTSLKNHLRAKHREEFGLCEIANHANNFKIKKEHADKTSPSAKTTMQMEQTLDTSSSNSIKIDKLIGEMIVLQNLQFNFVEGLGFRRIIQELAPTYDLRGQAFFTDFVCNELYGKVAAKVNELIEKYDYMSFTSDICTDPSSSLSLLSLTCHGLSENFERTSTVLKCETFDDRYTGDIIAEKFNTMLGEWNISKDKVHCIMRDEGSCMKRGMPLALFTDLDCTIHKMQNVIRGSLKSQENIKYIKQKLMIISKHFNNSTIAQRELEKIQDRLNQPHFKVLQDGVKRWNSTFYMFESFSKIKDAFSLYANDNNIELILPEEWRIIESCLELLKPFEEATSEMSNSQALISSVIPIIQILKKKIDDYLSKPSDSDAIRLAVLNLKTLFSTKFSSLEDNHLYAISTYLDPRFKHKFFKPVTEERIKDEILRMANVPSANCSPMLSSPTKKKIEDPLCTEPGRSGMSSFKSDMAMMLGSSSEDDGEDEFDSASPEALLRRELAFYRDKKRLALDWWKINQIDLKTLSKVARRYLAPPPASIPSEQLLSEAGLIYDPQINRLESDKTAILLFLKYNLPIFDFNY